MRLVYLVYLCFLMGGITGCPKVPAPPKPSPPRIVSSVLPPVAAKIPVWVTQPPQGCAVGFAHLHSIEHEAKAKAEQTARASLSRMLSAQVTERTTIQQRATKQTSSQHIHTHQTIRSHGTLPPVRFVSYWTDEFNLHHKGPGSIFVLACKTR